MTDESYELRKACPLRPGRKKAGRITALFLALVFFTVCSAGCSKDTLRSPFNINSIKSYRDIPGVTDGEIKAIEALKAKRQSFSCGGLLTTEMFIQPDGSYGGFTPQLCRLLSGLFGIPFIPEIQSWDDLVEGLTLEQSILPQSLPLRRNESPFTI